MGKCMKLSFIHLDFRMFCHQNGGRPNYVTIEREIIGIKGFGVFMYLLNSRSNWLYYSSDNIKV